MESPPAGRYGLQVPECTARQVAAGWSQRALCGTLGNVVYPRRGAWQTGGGAGREADYNSRQAVRGRAGGLLLRPVAGDSRDLGVAAGPWTAAAMGVRASSASSRRRQVSRQAGRRRVSPAQLCLPVKNKTAN